MGRKRRVPRGGWGGQILDIDGADWDIIPWAMKPGRRLPSFGPVCGCPPPSRNRLGGCRPALTWANEEHTALKAICRTCLKPLVAGHHKRRDQVHFLALASMNLDHLDLSDLEDAGFFIDNTVIHPAVVQQSMDQFALERVGGMP